MKTPILPLLLLLMACFFVASTPQDYPKDYFSSPVLHPLKISGTFGELRPNHFHTGLDIKPHQEIEPIVAAADGYVARILVSPFGYGNALFLAHANGYTTVYAHLQKFSPAIAAYVKAEQYRENSFALDLKPLSDKFLVKKGETIGFMGNSGGSLGRHLHFEIRDTETDVPINPLLFGLAVEDKTAPLMKNLKIYHLNAKAETLAENTFPILAKGGKITLPTDTIAAYSDYIGFGLKTYDLLSGTSNLNGIYALDVRYNDSLVFQFEMEKIPFEQSRYHNAHIDFASLQQEKNYFNRTYLLPGNQLQIYTRAVNRGLIRLNNSPQAQRITLTAYDYAGNATTLQFFVKRQMPTATPPQVAYNYFLPQNEPSIIQRSDIYLHFPRHTFYQDVYASLRVTPDASANTFSSVFHLKATTEIPVHTAFDLKIKFLGNLPDALRQQCYIARCGSERNQSCGGTWDGEWLTAQVSAFGAFCILLDTVPPTIVPLRTKNRWSKTDQLSFKIEDKQTGIKHFEAYLNDAWILMEYDAKNNLLFHQFDGRIPAGQHRLKLLVTDSVGNVRIYEQVFTLI